VITVGQYATFISYTISALMGLDITACTALQKHLFILSSRPGPSGVITWIVAYVPTLLISLSIKDIMECGNNETQVLKSLPKVVLLWLKLMFLVFWEIK
jgi:hypothetical protein